jgi:hypothetical protein
MTRSLAALLTGFLFLAGSLLFAGSCLAQASASPPAKIAEVEWLQGYWTGEGFGGQVDEQWTAARAGVMLGTFRSLKADGSPAFYELLGIEEFEGTLRMVVKHFNPDWVGWEENDKAFKATLTRIGPTEAVFGGVALKRVGENGLTVEVNVRRKDGSTQKQILNLRRQ